jgi:ribonuclease HIII
MSGICAIVVTDAKRLSAWALTQVRSRWVRASVGVTSSDDGKPRPMPAHVSAKISVKAPLQQQGLKRGFEQLPYRWQEKAEQYCLYRLDGQSAGGWVRVKQFANGTLYLEAEAATGLAHLQRVLAQVLGSSATTNGGTAHQVNARTTSLTKGGTVIAMPYFGTDESGKGDYFGPLTVAGVLASDETLPLLQTIGVADSKTLTESNINQQARQLQEALPESAWAIIRLDPLDYNATYAEFKARGQSLNQLLGSLHGQVLVRLLGQQPSAPHGTLPVTTAIVDQFGSLRDITMGQAKALAELEIHTFPKAESYAGVAAASILARAAFNEGIALLSSKWGLYLHPGAGTPTVRAAKQFVAQHGKCALMNVAKVHFKTTEGL